MFTAIKYYNKEIQSLTDTKAYCVTVHSRQTTRNPGSPDTMTAEDANAGFYSLVRTLQNVPPTGSES